MRLSLIVALLCCCGYAQAQGADSVLTLACQGTIANENDDWKPETTSMGIIINFTNRTTQGFHGPPGFFDSFKYPIRIIAWDDVAVRLGGEHDNGTSFRGTIDRVTGDVEADELIMSKKTTKLGHTRWTLKCRPAQRMF
jgi:hypothetical protein